MADLEDGAQVEVRGSAADPYVLKNVGGVYSCTCPAWRNQSAAIDRRTCKHLRALRGEDAETRRLGAPLVGPAPAADDGEGSTGDTPALLLAHRWELDQDPSGWWMSEKLDGVRAWWDGARFVSRLGNPFVAPDWFVAKLPPTPLDGELWGGRKLFQKTVSVVRRADAGAAWRDLTYVVFDAPAEETPFEDRMATVRARVEAADSPWVAAHAHQRCEGLDHLRAELARVEALGGEGLMLRQPRSRYQAGRSTSLLKVKTFFDAEGRVVGHAPGAGKHKGRLGALIVESEDGTRFNVGTGLSDREREDPPAIGEVVTYRYQELTDAGVPRFPSYVGRRVDAVFRPRPSAPVDAGEAFLALLKDLRPHLAAAKARLAREWPAGRPAVTALPELVLDRLGLVDEGLAELEDTLSALERAEAVVGAVVDAD